VPRRSRLAPSAQEKSPNSAIYRPISRLEPGDNLGQKGALPATREASAGSVAEVGWSCGREAEGGGLLNRYTVVKPYRGFESLRLRHFHFLKHKCLVGFPALACARSFAGQSPAGDCCFRLAPPAPPSPADAGMIFQPPQNSRGWRSRIGITDPCSTKSPTGDFGRERSERSSRSEDEKHALACFSQSLRLRHFLKHKCLAGFPALAYAWTFAGQSPARASRCYLFFF
jgi:hypothetical protein